MSNDPTPEPPTNDPTPDPDHDDAPGGSEAARYRRRLRDAEGQRDTLAERVALMQRGEVERLAAGQLATPADLWLIHTDVAEFVDDNGDVDAAKVSDVVSTLLAQRPTWARSAIPPGRGGPRGDAPPVGPQWADVLRGG